MLPNQQQMAYDRAITIFSPDGRLYQVEYAREAVKRGKAALGVAVDEGVVLGAYKRAATDLMEARDIEKLFKIDEHIGAASAGHVTDARKLVDILRRESQVNRTAYEEPIGVETVTRRLCDEMQVYTQTGGVRPFGVAVVVGGVERGEPRVFETDPSGSFYEWRATAIGRHDAAIRERFEEEYDSSMSLDETVAMAYEAVDDAYEDDVQPSNFDVTVLERDDPVYRSLSTEEVEDIV
ncbi:MAG: archaeal proteasome endopeptidase complex subunit alpha [Halobacteriales archaeon]